MKDKKLTDSVIYDKVDLNIVYLPEEFQPYRDEFDETYTFCVPPMEQLAVSNQQIPFQQMKKPIIYISIGTIMSSKLFYKKCIRAFGNKKLSIILNTGNVNPDLLGDIPSNIWAYSFVPQLEVLRRSDLFITHGGMNSVNEAMYYGVPMLVTPIINDQHENARQVEKLNLGQKTGSFLTTATNLYRLAMDALNNKEIKEGCKNMEEELKSGITLDEIIDKIEQII